MSKYVLVEDVNINDSIIQQHCIQSKPFAAIVTAPEFTADVLSSKQKLDLLNKYAEYGKQFVMTDFGISDSEFTENSWAIVLGIVGWRTVEFDVEHNNKPHAFGDYFVCIPPVNQPYVTDNYADCLHQTKRLITVYRKPFKIYQENKENPLLVDTVNFHAGHAVSGPMSDGYDKYAIPVYLYMLLTNE